MAGGPCAFNAEPFSAFFDVFLLGEGEESLPELLVLHREMKQAGASRAEFLRAASHLEGCYVPSLYDVLDEDEAQQTGAWRHRSRGCAREYREARWRDFATSPALSELTVVPFAELVSNCEA